MFYNCKGRTAIPRETDLIVKVVVIASVWPCIVSCLEVTPTAIQQEVLALGVAGRGPDGHHVGVDGERWGHGGETLIEDDTI